MWELPSGEDADLPPQLRLPLPVDDAAAAGEGEGEGERVPVRGRIVLVWKGRTGNCLFQYATARALHELLGFELVMAKDAARLTGMFPDAGPRPAKRRPRGWQPDDVAGDDVTFTRHMRMDVLALAADRRQRTITIDAYGQNARYFKHFLGAARRWFASAKLAAPPVVAGRPLGPGDVVVHARAGDMSAASVEEVQRGGPGLVPMPSWYWDGVLERVEAAGPPVDRLIVVTEPGGDKTPAVQHLRSAHGAVVVPGTAEDDFARLLHAPRVLQSCSTFGWWAAALRRRDAAHLPILGLCDPAFPIAAKGPEEVLYDAGIQGWRFHDAFSLPTTPKGFRRQY